VSTSPSGVAGAKPFLRVLALLAALVIPLVWLASLSGSPDHRTANFFRVAGALFGGSIAWTAQRALAGSTSWKACLGGGVAGSLVITAVSVAVPALGHYAASGWLTSGVAGGGMIALALYAVRGGANA
jgi:hypothetical protein